MAATNYAIEGVTGEWAALVCSRDTYELGFPEAVRKSAMKWLRAHAEYDDKHPWEALEIIATVLGHEPDETDIAGVRSRIRKSYDYMRLTLDECLGRSAIGNAQDYVTYTADAA
jgi:pyrroloquinoline quinone (PQQ) biosynthesis protein C